jgi:hypothetical protein
MIDLKDIFDLLDNIEKRPGMYLGGNGFTNQLRALEMYLIGYSTACYINNIKEPGSNFIGDFDSFIVKKYKLRSCLGPIGTIIQKNKTEEEAWKMFWSFVREFKDEYKKTNS